LKKQVLSITSKRIVRITKKVQTSICQTFCQQRLNSIEGDPIQLIISSATATISVVIDSNSNNNNNSIVVHLILFKIQHHQHHFLFGEVLIKLYHSILPPLRIEHWQPLC